MWRGAGGPAGAWSPGGARRSGLGVVAGQGGGLAWVWSPGRARGRGGAVRLGLCGVRARAVGLGHAVVPWDRGVHPEAGEQKLGGGGNPGEPSGVLGGRDCRGRDREVVMGCEPHDQAVERLLGERGQHLMRAAVALTGSRADGEDLL